jgi:hypothetical protein
MLPLLPPLLPPPLLLAPLLPALRLPPQRPAALSVRVGGSA